MIKYSVKRIVCFIVALISLSLCSCKKNQNNEIDEAVESSDNPFVRVDYYNNKGIIMKEEYFSNTPYSVVYTYDDTNRILNAKLSTTDNGRTLYKLNCYYDNDGNLCNKITYDSSGIISENCTYSYKNGIVIKEDITSYSASDGKTVIVKNYDNNGNLVKITGDDYYIEFSEDTESKYVNIDGSYELIDEKTLVFDETGNLLKEVHQNFIVSYIYDSQGRLEKKYTYEPDDSNDENITIGVLYTYDDSNNIVREQTYRFFGERTDLEYDIEMFYDKYNNLIKKTTNGITDLEKEYLYYDNGQIKEIRYLILEA